MAKRNVGFVDNHIEKVVVGLCALLLLGAVVFTFGGFRFMVNEFDPARLCEEARTQGDLLAQAFRNVQPRQSESDEKVASQNPLEEWFGPSARHLIQIAGVEAPPFRTQRFPPLVVSISGVNPEDRHGLARIVAPSTPIVTAGRTTFELPTKLEFDEVVQAGPDTEDVKQSTRSWISVAAQVDLVEQDVNFRAEKYPAGSYLTVVKVYLQRRDLTEPGSDWQSVETYLPFKPFKRPQVGESLEEFRRDLDWGSDWIARTKPPGRRTGDRVILPWVPYLDKPPDVPHPEDSPVRLQQSANRRARTWRELAKKAMDGRTPSKIVDLDAALILARAAVGSGAIGPEMEKSREFLDELIKKLPRKQREAARRPAPAAERLMPLLAHDLDVIPGHSYRYRMRYEVLNRYAGIRGELSDPTDAEMLTVFSEWSPPSRPVEAVSDVLFYLTKADRKRKEVTVTVYRKARTGWKNKDFKIKVGDEIGRNDRRVKKADFTTDTICVGIDFNRVVNKNKTTALVYLDKNTGMLRERLLSVDKKNKLRRKLD